MDTRQRYINTDNLLSVLTLHSYRRNLALGLPRPGARTLSLLDYKRQREREVTKSLAGAAFLRAIIENCQSDVKQMIADADTPEKRREALVEAERLNVLAEKAAVELEKMTYGG